MCHDVHAVKAYSGAEQRWISIFRWSRDRSSVWWPRRRTVWKSCGWGAWKPAVSRRRLRSSRAYRCTSCGGTFRRTAGPDSAPVGPPVLMVHPMMMSADMWDVTREDGAVGILHASGLDPWVIDFGSPDKVEGGMRRNLADHIVALSQAIDTVQGRHRPGRAPRRVLAGRDVVLPGRGIPAFEEPRQHRGVRLPGGHPGRAADGHAGELRPPASPTSWPITCSTGWTSQAGWRAPVFR